MTTSSPQTTGAGLEARLRRARVRYARRLAGTLGALSLAGMAVGWRAAAPRL